MPGLMDTLQAIQSGSQQGDAMTQGMIPSASQPKGSPQLYIQTIDEIRREVGNLNRIMDGAFRAAGTDDVMHRSVSELMTCIQKLQGISTDLEKHLKDLQAQAAPGMAGGGGQQAAQQQPQQQQQQGY